MHPALWFSCGLSVATRYEEFEYGMRAKVLLAAAKGHALDARGVMRDMDTRRVDRLSRSQFKKALRKLHLDLSDQEATSLSTRCVMLQHVPYRFFVLVVTLRKHWVATCD